MPMTSLDAHEITSGLWIGSIPPVGSLVSRAGFHQLALCAIEYQPSSDVFKGLDIARIPLIDDGTPLSQEQFQQAINLAAYLAYGIRHGKRTLVTCLQGRNRSGLIASLTLCRLTGCAGRVATQVVRTKRKSEHGPALCNASFVEALRCIPAAGTPARGPIIRQAS